MNTSIGTENDHRVTTSSTMVGVGQINHNFGHWYTKIININISGSFPVIMKTHCMLGAPTIICAEIWLLDTLT